MLGDHVRRQNRFDLLYERNWSALIFSCFIFLYFRGNDRFMACVSMPHTHNRVNPQSTERRPYCRVIEIQLFHFADYLCLVLNPYGRARNYSFVCDAQYDHNAAAIYFIMMIDQSNQVKCFCLWVFERCMHTLHIVSLNSIKWFHFKPAKISRTSPRKRNHIAELFVYFEAESSSFWLHKIERIVGGAH